MTDPRRSQAIPPDVEAVARAICISRGSDPDRAPFGEVQSGWPMWRDHVDAAKAAIEAMAAVPPAEPQEGEKKRLDDVYAERNAVALAFAWMASNAGWKVGEVVDPDEPDWPVLMIDTHRSGRCRGI